MPDKKELKPIGLFDNDGCMKKFRIVAALACAAGLASCGLIEEAEFRNNDAELWSFGQDLSFFSKYGVESFVLGEEDSLIVVSPLLQGRVMTSTYGGAEGPSLGWFNKELLALKNSQFDKSQVGGEDRFWVGPQGGDFSIFFQGGSSFTEENWSIPASLSLEPWTVVGRSKTQARFEKEAEFENNRGGKYKVKAEREVSVLNRKHVTDILGIEIPTGVNIVAFQSFNKLTNLGEKTWTPDNGMLNISVQSCFNANRKVFVFVPYRPGEPSELGDIVRDNYFESTGASGNRLAVMPDYIRFKTDGKSISGIGISPRRSEGIALSYDGANNILTVVTYIKPSGLRGYLPNAWRRNNAPMDGDAVSVYNNGPVSKINMVADSFYEISTHSPALSLEPGKSQFHLQRVFHFNGSEYDLGLIAYKLVGISIGQLRGETDN